MARIEPSRPCGRKITNNSRRVPQTQIVPADCRGIEGDANVSVNRIVIAAPGVDPSGT
jgi:hypothetical protein